DTCNAGLMEGAKEFNIEAAGFTVAMDKANFTVEGQIDKLRQYATEPEIIGIAISPFEADNKTIADEMRKLQEQGKKVITVDADLNRERFRDARSFYIGTDNSVGGRALGTAARAVLQSKGITSGGYVQFAGSTVNDNARNRMNGVAEALGKEYTELDRMPDNGNHQKAHDNVRTSLDNHGDKIAVLFGIWAYNAPAIADVVAQRKVRDKLTIATFDAASNAIKAMHEGNVDVMVVQNPFDMGRQSVRLLKAMVTGDEATLKAMYPNQGQPDGDVYTTGLRVVVSSEGSPVKPELFDPKVVEFMTLSQFQAWLDKYGLKSS
ncbi:MAG: substrate-binding domain-containing protein, partial [Planctomycetaceae bacterium]|nr:substrate-binding domain-containing protein [Planctomycetaceae bacterium]